MFDIFQMQDTRQGKLAVYDHILTCGLASVYTAVQWEIECGSKSNLDE
jgi:hypothetical protein